VSVETELERELDRLYELPPGEFTSARDEAVKRLRGEGHRELADEVKQLRKPTVAVWLVNRLARERTLDVQRLLKGGEALAKSQAAAAGGAPDAFAEARREEQHALERLADAARELARRENVGAPAVERAVQTLRAASLTAEGRELLKQGRLTEELQPPGFDALTSGAAPSRRRAKPGKPAARKDDRQERRRLAKEARERLSELRSRERELATAARTAQREAERAEKEAAALRERAGDAEAKAAAAVKERASAEAELERLK
jgi:hypothetical protein